MNEIVEQTHFAVCVSDDRKVDRGALSRIDILDPLDVRFDRVDRQGDHLDAALRELVLKIRGQGAYGGSGIALRGLSEKYTLVLVDGQRAAPYAEPSNGTDAFVDLNSLPLNAIERIEVVKTGAVSEYGSDAIAGVVNIITKKDIQGLEVAAAWPGGRTYGTPLPVLVRDADEPTEGPL